VVLESFHVALGFVSAIFARLEGLYLDAELALRLISVIVVVSVVFVDHVASLTVLFAEHPVVLERISPFVSSLIVI